MAKVLAEYETILEPLGFIRTHRSHLVNKMHISAINEAGQIVMVDTSCAEVSRRKKKEVFARINLTQVAA
jgi:two-component system LytT family response regulator